MGVELKRHRFTRADYHRMAQVGILEYKARVELIDGDVIEKNRESRRQRAGVDRFLHILPPNLWGTAIVRVRGSIVLDDYNEPEPDVTLLRYRADFYADSDETPGDVLLIVEVADTSEGYDRRHKAPLYARCNIPELWIADLNRD